MYQAVIKNKGFATLYLMMSAVILAGGAWGYGLHQKIKAQNGVISELETANKNQQAVIEELKKDKDKIDALAIIEMAKARFAEAKIAALAKSVTKLRGENAKVKAYLDTVVPDDLANVLCGSYGARVAPSKSKANNLNAPKTGTPCIATQRGETSNKRPNRLHRSDGRHFVGILPQNGHFEKLLYRGN